MMFPLVITIFALICTYFVINIYSNKGVMTDTHFYIAFVILSVILVFVLSTRSIEKFEQPSAIIEYTKQNASKLHEKAVHVTHRFRKDVYPKVAEFVKHVTKCVKESAIKSKLSEKFLSLS